LEIQSSPVAEPLSPSAAVSPTQGDATQMTQSAHPSPASTNVVPSNVPPILRGEIITTPVSRDLEGLIDIAKQDLARRLEIIPEGIEVLLIETAEWPDTSLGCAEPGLSRRPVAIPGYRLVLSTMGREYVYHTNRDSGVVFCPKG